MRKRRSTSTFIIGKQSSPQPAVPRTVAGFLCSFLMFFSASLGFLLSLFTALSVPWNSRFYAPALLLLSLLFAGVCQVEKPRHRLVWLLAFSGAGSFLLYVIRKPFLLEYRSFLGNLQNTLETSYQLTWFPDYPWKGEDYLFFAPVSVGIFLLLFSLAVISKKQVCILLLLVLPAGMDFFLNQNPTFSSIGFLLSAFLFWSILYKANFSSFLVPGAVLLLYFFCARILVPWVAPRIFPWCDTVYQTVNQLGTELFSGLDTTRETSDSQLVLSNQAPIHTRKTMFRFTSSLPLSEAVYLRGFVGETYTESQWTAPKNSQWESFLHATKKNTLQAQVPFQIPFQAVTDSRKELAVMSLDPAFSASYSYLPWGVEILPELLTGEDNRVENPFRQEVTFSGFPLSLSNMQLLESPGLSSKEASVEKLYRTYVTQEYTQVDADTRSTLSDEISRLPVYQSMGETPSLAQITEAAKEIQQFLWEHASYSLSLETVPSDSSFLNDFLYRQHRGFCIHFATAGTLLFRMYGIPARYVNGYVLWPEDLTQTADGNYFCEISDSSAHAWTEIYVGQGGWIPVEMTPPGSQETPEAPIQNAEEEPVPEERSKTPAENTPETVPENPVQEDSAPDMERLSAEKNTPDAPSFLSVMRSFLLTGLGIAALFTVLLLRRVICFRKRLGYFASSYTHCFQIVFKNLLKLWERLYGISSAGLSDSDLYQLFVEKLPEKDKTLFVEFYQQAEQFTFGQEKPEKAEIRTLRHTYCVYRKKLLAGSSLLQKLYYSFLLGL